MLIKSFFDLGIARGRSGRLALLVIVAFTCWLRPTTLAAAATISYVQSDYATPQTPQTTVNVTFTTAQSAGDLNIVVVGWNDTTAVVDTVTDKSGNTYMLAVGPTLVSGSLSQSIYYAKNIAAAAAGANIVTVTFSVAAVSADIRILEYSGADPNIPVDVTAAGSGSSATSTSASTTTTNATDLVFGANTVYTLTKGPGSGFTNRLLTSPDGDIAEDRMVSATGSYSATAPLTSSGAWIMQMVAFRTPSGGATPPTVSSVSPNRGSTAGGTAVTITGANFAAGATVTFGATAATNVSVTNSTTITATTPAGSAGAVTVTVTVGGQSGSLTGGFSYVAIPTVSSVSPNRGSTAGGTAVTITGANFAAGATVTFGATAATNVSVTNSTTITATTPAGTAGAVTVTVTVNGQSGSLTNGFTYTPAPVVSGVSPNSGSTAGGTAVTITGANFAAGATVTFAGTAATNVVVANSTTITATTPAGSAGAVTVTVTVGGQSGSLTNGYTYLVIPTVSSVSPNSGPTAGGTAVAITGTNFAAGATVTFAGTAATNVVVANSTTITATTPAKSAGAVTVTVTVGGQSGSLASGFTYVGIPTVSSVSPNSGPTAGGTAVTITGTNFAAGATVTFAGTAATNVSVTNSTTITATTPAGTAGAVTVTVTVNGQSGSLTNGFTYSLPPTVSSISPNSGPTAGGTSVTITGTNFAAGATVTFGGTAATNVLVTNSTTITATTPAGSAGAVTVTVTVSGQSGSLTGGFTYTGVSKISYVQGNYATPQSSQTTVSVTFTAAQAAGDLNVVVVGWNNSTATVSTVSDKSGNAYTLAVGPTVQSGVASQSIYYAKNIAPAAAGANIITVTFSRAAASPDIRILEYSGADPSNPVDVTAAGSGSSTTSSSGAVTTTNATDLLFGANLIQTITSGPGSGFTERLLTSPDGDIAEDEMVSATGSYSATAPISSGQWIMQMVAFRTSSGGGTTPPTVSSVSPNSGPTAGGTAVTIMGTNFASGATVTFGGTAATNVVVANSTTITATTPAESAGAVTVTVTVSGQSGSLTSGFTYVVIPPTVSSVSPNSGSTAGGTVVTIAGTSFAAGATVTFGGTVATNVAVANSTTITATTPAGSVGAVTVTVTVNGQSGSLTGGFTYGFFPAVTSVSPNSGPAAGGTVVTITGTNFAAGATVTFGGAAATNVAVANSTTITATTPAGSVGAVTVTVTVNGQSGSLTNGFSYTGPPTAPSKLTATAASPSQINLSWTASTSSVGLANYIVQRCQGAGCTSFVQIATPSGTAYSDTGLMATTSYSYQVQAVDTAGNLSLYSNVASAATGFLFPLMSSSNKRYLIDQNETPFLIMGDSPQAMVGNLTPSEMASYMADRENLGFNSLWVNLLCDQYTFCNSNGTTYAGIAPFTSGSSPSNYDLSTPNEAYFSIVDNMVNLAAADNLVVFLDPIETGGWLVTLENNGSAKAYNYGVYIGNRYKSFPNIVWLNGNDFNAWSTSTDNNLVKQVMAGIASVDSNHLQTIELNDTEPSYSNQDSALGSLLAVDSAYTYNETYDIILQSYNSSPTIPTYLVESNYEYENNTGALPGPAGTYVLREQAYWTLLSGGSGQLYGNHYTVTFTAGWQSFLDSPGALEIKYINQLFSSVAWWNLVPDQTHQVVTAGYGSYDGSNSNNTKATYCAASWITDGSLALTYCPNASTLTVNLGKFSGPVTAEWYDPSNGTYTPISGSPFPNSGTQNFTTPGNNNDGNPDWVLVLEN